MNAKASSKAIALALTQMLGSSQSRQTIPELITGPNGLPGYVIQADKFYVFQPLWAKDRKIPLDTRVLLPSSLSTETRLLGTADKENNDEAIRAEILLHDIDREPDLILKFTRLDYGLSDLQRVHVLEYLIQTRPESPLLNYFRNFLIFDDSNRLYGHFLSTVPRCLTQTGWFSCNLEDKKKIDRFVESLYLEPEANFVGYMQQTKARPSFKIVNNTSQRDKTRLDLETALNTVTKGKTCGTYDRVILNYIVRQLNVTVDKEENKSVLCKKLEYAFRSQQHQDKNNTRYFYNVIETQQKKQLSKRRT